MTHTKDEALRMALEALEYWDVHGKLHQPTEEAITAIKQALAAQQEHEPENEPHVSLASVQDNDAHYKGVVEGVQKLFDDKRAQQEPVGTYGEIFESMLSLLRTGLQRDQQIYMAMKDKPLYTTPPAAPVQSCYCPNCEAIGKELAALKAQPHATDLTHDQWDEWQDKHGLILERDALDDLRTMLAAQPAPTVQESVAWVEYETGNHTKCVMEPAPVQQPVGALLLGGVIDTSDGPEYEEWDVEWNTKAVEALQEKLVTSNAVTLMLYTTPPAQPKIVLQQAYRTSEAYTIGFRDGQAAQPAPVPQKPWVDLTVEQKARIHNECADSISLAIELTLAEVRKTAAQPAVPLTEHELRAVLEKTNHMITNTMRGPFWPELEQACRAIEAAHGITKGQQ